MTLIARPAAPVVDRPELAVPKSVAASCHCESKDPDLVRLRDLVARGVSQQDASRIVWSPDRVPAEALAARDPGTWARDLVRTSLAALFPWLKLPNLTEVPHP